MGSFALGYALHYRLDLVGDQRIAFPVDEFLSLIIRFWPNINGNPLGDLILSLLPLCP